jgi:predicted site-specific integrase-resolvase
MTATMLADALSPSEAAHILGVAAASIRQMRRTGKLVTVQIDGRTAWVTRDSVEQYLRCRKPKGRPRAKERNES